ncbi:MAG TPA: Yip1 family protein [Xanthobacteraceae bacterium]|jgi:hypothetical protein|nr:Yip1 family protein [Xanthobacteraceae bacterium]
MGLLSRVKGVLLAPDIEWRRIAREDSKPSELLLTYVAVLAAIPAVADFLGMTLIGFTLPNGRVARVDYLSGFMIAAFGYAMAFAVVAILAGITHMLTPTFGAARDLPTAYKLVVYSLTPMWLAGIFLLVPGLHFLIMLGLYGLYLMFKGIQVLMRTTAENAFLFAGIVTICSVVIALIVGVTRAKLFSLPGII